MPKKHSSIVVIGGGTGSFTILQALKNLNCDITALVNMADDGGSTGVLRDELGVLPPGDVRQCLVALSDAPEELRELFTFRFPAGTFKGHSFGNIFLSAVESMTSDFNDAVRIASDILRLRGRVLPVTLDNCQLIMDAGDKHAEGQYTIEQTKLTQGTRPILTLTPPARLNPEAASAIAHANLIVIAPGNLYASLAPALIVEGMADALKSARAPIAFINNLVNKPNHTVGYAVHDYANEIERLIGAPVLTHVLYNTDTPSEGLLQKYALDKEFPVLVDAAALKKAHYKPIAGNFLSHAHHKRNKNDSFIQRSLIRHDGEAVAKTVRKLCK
jgi:uncharacterized cofD-like protein